MKSLFRSLPRSLADAPATAGPLARSIEIEFDGQALTVPADVSVAAALLLSGVRQFRETPVSGAPRAPYCMMGVCFECLVEIDGVPSQQSCMRIVQPGMRVRTQHGARVLAQRGEAHASPLDAGIAAAELDASVSEAELDASVSAAELDTGRAS